MQRTWDELGRTDPLWAVLSWPDKRGGRWDLDEFLATGVREIDEMLSAVEALGIAPTLGHALDFGCGVGRLTQPLAARFERATGVDIAPSMIERAQSLNKHGDRCRYVLNQRGDLSLFADDTFDLVYSNITLQHMPPRLMRTYLAEFVRVLTTDGVCVFQLPVRPPPRMSKGLRSLVPISTKVAWRLRRARGAEAMFWASPKRVSKIVRSAGGRFEAIQDDPNAGWGWVGKRYFVRSRRLPY